jgi:hypothetical protein
MYERPASRPAGRYGYLVGPDRGMSGTGLVADDLYLLGHDDRSGRPLVSPRPLGTGLAGALLAELFLAGCVGVRPDTAVVTGRLMSRAALDGHEVLRQIAGEPVPLPVRDWLRFLARSAVRDTGLRLERAGYLARVRSRIPGRAGRLVPVNPDWAHMPVLRALDARGRDLTPGEADHQAARKAAHAAALAGLAEACGLGFRLDQYQARAGRGTAEAVAALPLGLRVLITQTQVTVAATVLSQRT